MTKLIFRTVRDMLHGLRTFQFTGPCVTVFGSARCAPDHPYYAVTKPDGSFSIDGVPPGKYTLVAWHERTGKSEQTVEVAANGAAKVSVALEGK